MGRLGWDGWYNANEFIGRSTKLHRKGAGFAIVWDDSEHLIVVILTSLCPSIHIAFAHVEDADVGHVTHALNCWLIRDQQLLALNGRNQDETAYSLRYLLKCSFDGLSKIWAFRALPASAAWRYHVFTMLTVLKVIQLPVFASVCKLEVIWLEKINPRIRLRNVRHRAPYFRHVTVIPSQLQNAAK